MKIVIEGVTVETKEIYDINAFEYNLIVYQVGFTINLIDKPSLSFCERVSYFESTPEQRKAIKEKWKKLREKVYQEWQKDKSELTIFKAE